MIFFDFVDGDDFILGLSLDPITMNDLHWIVRSLDEPFHLEGHRSASKAPFGDTLLDTDCMKVLVVEEFVNGRFEFFDRLLILRLFQFVLIKR